MGANTNVNALANSSSAIAPETALILNYSLLL
jgi:hypothetical protein